MNMEEKNIEFSRKLYKLMKNFKFKIDIIIVIHIGHY